MYELILPHRQQVKQAQGLEKSSKTCTEIYEIAKNVICGTNVGDDKNPTE
jgi:hypothetical protein